MVIVLQRYHWLLPLIRDFEPQEQVDILGLNLCIVHKDSPCFIPNKEKKNETNEQTNKFFQALISPINQLVKRCQIKLLTHPEHWI